MRAVLSRSVMISTILSALEVYKKETYGILLGRKRNGAIMLDQAATFQTAVRDYEYVSLDKARENRINNTLRYISGMKVVGDFHSHPDGPDKLSKHDMKELHKGGKDDVSLLLFVKKSPTKQKWKYDVSRRRISGTAGGYFIGISVWIYDYKNDKAVKIPLSSRHVAELNGRMKLYDGLDRQLEKIDKIERKSKRMKALINAKKMRI